MSRPRWDDPFADLRHALRSLRRNPGFSLTVLLTLGLGIGATAAVFSAIDAVLLAPLPYPEPDRLVRIYQQNSPTNRWTISVADWQAIEAQQRSFESVALVRPGGAALSTDAGAEWVDVGRATSGIFRTLGVTPARGRGFRPDEDEPGAAPVAVVREGFWERRFGGGDPVGRSLVLDGVSHTVVGVLPGGTRLAGWGFDVWPVLQVSAPDRRGPFGYHAYGRLRPGVTLDAAARDLAGISERIFPRWSSSFQDRTARLTPYSLRDVIVGDADRPLTVLAAAVVLVLLIAVANVANLVLVRSTGRTREMAVRSALGASRGRLARQLLTESVALSGLAGALGLAVAVLGLEALNAVGPGLPRLQEAALDLRAVGFTATVALLAGAVVGIAPLAFGATRSEGASLRSGDARAGTDRRTRWLQDGFVASEFALALPLLLGAGLLLHSFLNLRGVDPGFEPERLLTARVSLTESEYSDPGAALAFWDEALRRVRAVPGVVEAGLATSLPPDNQGDTNNFDLVAKPVPPGGAQPVAPWSWASPGLFRALGVPLLEGRLLRETDDGDAPPVVVVSRAWAARHFPEGGAVGRRLRAGGCTDCEPSTVVGVVGDVKYEGLAGGGEAVYEALWQAPLPRAHLVVRTAAAPGGVAGPVREAIRELDPAVPVHDVVTMQTRLADSVADPRRLTWLVGVFAALAALLAALGVFGVTSYAVARRRREIGVRIVVGADRGAILGMVVRRGVLRAAVGLAVGVLLSLEGARLLEAVLFGVDSTDPFAVGAAAGLLLCVALAGCWLPGLRAARTDPVEVLSAE